MDKNLISAWIKYHATENRDLFWAWEKLNAMVQDAPEEAWQYILEITASTDDLKVLSNLAAGPLEDLLHLHGSSFIERVETKSRQWPKFTGVVKGVWPSEFEKGVQGRINAIQAKYS